MQNLRQKQEKLKYNCVKVTNKNHINLQRCLSQYSTCAGDKKHSKKHQSMSKCTSKKSVSIPNNFMIEVNKNRCSFKLHICFSKK